ncbi:heterokaryon incompatibility protein-domain-containing protein [Hypoxylon trugodes]|uniref:heterokaryon incompatibility protein-domain-containing protein n=1 Tax=Hypoxylon trugodes TaxID=326681 RepID=UPI00218CA255|nr:heterokaryon incompatibility protein-domain-containing protein [Hypoxylon trugodes]KAI1384133.1 heterokaryon incompatibility protein-domain-containing protein [Hypoxylon trugodes]
MTRDDKTIGTLSLAFERIFAGPRIAINWTTALALMGKVFGLFLTHLSFTVSCYNTRPRPGVEILAYFVDPELPSKVLSGDSAFEHDRFYDRDMKMAVQGRFDEPNTMVFLRERLEFFRKFVTTALTTPKSDSAFLIDAWECWFNIFDRFSRDWPTVSIRDPTRIEKDPITDPESKLHQPLSSGKETIRLPVLHPSMGVSSDISCELILTDLSVLSALGVETVPYYILPYVWTIDTGPREKIYLDGQQHHIHPLLCEAFRNFRESEVPVLLWIDSVCSNTESAEEEAHHFEIANSIIDRAAAVIYHDKLPTDLSTNPRPIEDDLVSRELKYLGVSLEEPAVRFPVIFPPKLPSGEAENFFPYEDYGLPTTTSIRLLIILPIDNIDDEGREHFPIKCSMHTVDLKESPEYNALSYTWGCPLGLQENAEDERDHKAWSRKDYKIECDGQTVSISANLFTLLLALRLKLNSEDQEHFKNGPQTRSIWIDALCINQDDTEEKSKQVAMMSNIYRQATSTIAWLGGEDELTRDALEFIRLLGRKYRGMYYAQERTFARVFFNFETLMDVDLFASHMLGLPLLTPRRWAALRAFFSRSWFERTWIVQEVCLAQDVIVMCGLELLSYHSLLPILQVNSGRSNYSVDDSAETISQFPGRHDPLWRNLNRQTDRDWTNFQKGLGLAVRTYLTSLRITFAKSNVTSREEGFPKLIDNISFFDEFRATDERDRVYSLLGISAETQGKLPVELVPDYKADASTVFIRASKFVIKSSNSLSLLSLVPDPGIEIPPSKDHPTWVPYFSLPLTCGQLDSLTNPRFAAASSLSPIHIDFPEGNRLEVRGFCFGSIESRGCLKQGWLLSDLLSVVLQLPAFPLVDKDINDEMRQQGRFEVLWRTLVSDSVDSESPAKSEHGDTVRKIFRAGMKQLQAETRDIVIEQNDDLKKREQLEKFSTEYKALQQILGDASGIVTQDFPPEFQQFLESIRLNDSPKETIKLVHDAALEKSSADLGRPLQSTDDEIRETHRGRSLFRTNTGYLGHGPRFSTNGDEVWVLASGSVPFVLRNVNENQFQLVGECYVHGIMHGEAVREGAKNARIISII